MYMSGCAECSKSSELANYIHLCIPRDTVSVSPPCPSCLLCDPDGPLSSTVSHR